MFIHHDGMFPAHDGMFPAHRWRSLLPQGGVLTPKEIMMWQKSTVKHLSLTEFSRRCAHIGRTSFLFAKAKTRGTISTAGCAVTPETIKGTNCKAVKASNTSTHSQPCCLFVLPCYFHRRSGALVVFVFLSFCAFVPFARTLCASISYCNSFLSSGLCHMEASQPRLTYGVN